MRRTGGYCVRFAVLSALAMIACDRSPLAPKSQGAGRQSIGSSPEVQVGLNPIDSSYRAIAAIAAAFGGMYLDNAENFVVVLTDTTRLASARSAIISVFGPKFEQMYGAHQWRAARGSFNYSILADWRDQLAPAVFATPDGVSIGIDQRRNRVRLGVRTAEAIIALAAVVQKAGIPENAVAIEIRAAPVIGATLRDRHRPLSAGFVVYQGDFACSMGVNATNNGPVNHWFLAASHCTPVWGGFADMSVMHQTNVSAEADRIGVETLDAPTYPPGGTCPAPQGELCMKVDVAMIQYDNLATADFGYIARTNFPRRSTPGSITLDASRSGKVVINNVEGYHGTPPPVIGSRLDKVGKSSGWTYGTLDQICETYRMQGPGEFRVLQCQNLVLSYFTGGDSGAPVFLIDPYAEWAWFYGIATAYGPDHDYYIYSPMSAIYSELSINPDGIYFCGC
jgi:hypothetical protein